jgi:hypothetical protein
MSTAPLFVLSSSQCVVRRVCVTQELYASGHVMDPPAAAAVSDMLCVNTTLHTLCVGDAEFGDQVRRGSKTSTRSSATQ